MILLTFLTFDGCSSLLFLCGLHIVDSSSFWGGFPAAMGRTSGLIIDIFTAS